MEYLTVALFFVVALVDPSVSAEKVEIWLLLVVSMVLLLGLFHTPAKIWLRVMMVVTGGFGMRYIISVISADAILMVESTTRLFAILNAGAFVTFSTNILDIVVLVSLVLYMVLARLLNISLGPSAAQSLLYLIYRWRSTHWKG